MPAHPWELRADVGPIEAAAARWTDTATVLTRRGDEIIDAARRASEGWDATAAESYERHRRDVLAHLDRFAQLATQVAGSLRAVSTVLTSTQKELDRSWATVALVPHETVGESRHLVFHASEDDDRGKVTRGQVEADEIRARLRMALDQESTRLRAAGAELASVRTELTTLAGGAFRQLVAPVDEATGVGVVATPSTSVPSTSVPGSAQAGGAAGLPPIGPLSVSTPDLTGITGPGGLAAAGLSSLAGAAASGLAGRDRRRTTNAVPPMGGMGAGAMGARAGTMSRGMASGRSGPQRLGTPQLSGQDDDPDARSAREKDAKLAEKEAKQAALAQKRAERAARRAEREAGRGEQDRSGTDEPDDELDDGLDDGLDDERDDGDAPAGLLVVETDQEDPAPRR